MTAKGLTAKECSTKYQAAKAAGTLERHEVERLPQDRMRPPARRAAAAARQGDDQGSRRQQRQGPEHGRLQRQVSGGQGRQHAGRQEVERLPQGECGAGAADDDTVPAADEATYTSEPEKPSVAAPQGREVPDGDLEEICQRDPGKGRMHTCLELYYANKDANTLGGLKWIQKGGGFYSLCNAKLKS